MPTQYKGKSMSDLRFTLVNLKPAFIMIGIFIIAYHYAFNGIRTNKVKKNA